jgi:ABC-type uncharacterized transport system substrate-binding protein
MHSHQWKRREFITLLGGAAAAWPLTARAQQSERMRRIGVLMPFTADDLEGRARLAAFMQALQQLGWADGRNMRIEYRWAAGDAARVRSHAKELVALAPDLIFATGGTTVGPLQEATRTLPIVFVQVPDPVGAGFVASLSRPGGNATGFTQFEYGISGGRQQLPAVYPFRFFVTGGGLISYGPDTIDPYRRAAGYVDRILKGENPADLPVQHPTKLELVVNLKTAKALGLDVPTSLIARDTSPNRLSCR